MADHASVAQVGDARLAKADILAMIILLVWQMFAALCLLLHVNYFVDQMHVYFSFIIKRKTYFTPQKHWVCLLSFLNSFWAHIIPWTPNTVPPHLAYLGFATVHHKWMLLSYSTYPPSVFLLRGSGGDGVGRGCGDLMMSVSILCLKVVEPGVMPANVAIPPSTLSIRLSKTRLDWLLN